MAETVKFSAESLLELQWSDRFEGFEKVALEVHAEHRWTVERLLVFRHESTGDRLWGVLFHDGATEMQDLDDDQVWGGKRDPGGDVECFEVVAVPSVTYRRAE